MLFTEQQAGCALCRDWIVLVQLLPGNRTRPPGPAASPATRDRLLNPATAHGSSAARGDARARGTNKEEDIPTTTWLAPRGHNSKFPSHSSGRLVGSWAIVLL